MIQGRDRVHEDLVWLADVLWGSSGQFEVTIGGADDHPAVSLESYLILPSATRPRFLAPHEPPEASTASLRAYNSIRPTRMRVSRWVLATGLRMGLVQLVLRDRLHVRARGEPRQAAEALLSEHLREVFGRSDLVAAVGIGRPGPNRKPVLQVFTTRGEPLGYVKLGWNEFTRRLVKNEAAVLAAWAEQRPVELAVPRLIHQGQFEGLELAVISPLPTGVRRVRPTQRPPAAAIREVGRLHGSTSCRLAESPYWMGVQDRVARVAAELDPAASDGLISLVKGLGEKHGEDPFTFATWHGDWVPWNMARAGSRLFILDWEHAEAGIPLGLDALHFDFQAAFLLKGLPFPRALARAARLARPTLRDLSVESASVPALTVLYVLELFFRAHRARMDGAGTNPRLYPALLRCFEAAARGERPIPGDRDE